MKPPFQDRLLTLSTGQTGLRATLQIETAEASAPDSSIRNTGDAPSAPVLDFIASDETLDRYGEVIAASGWKLQNYLRNPVFQNAHQYGDVIFTLGKALITEVRTMPSANPAGPARSILFQRIQFATNINPMARIAYGLYRGKFLNAVSVGFVPKTWENGTDKTAYQRKFIEQELLEVSAVSIPANPNALELGLKSGAVEKADVKELSELLRQALEIPAPSAADPAESTSKNASRQRRRELLATARELRDLLKL